MRRTWKTKGGEKIKIKNMTTNHIQNCIKVLKRYQNHKLMNLIAFGDGLRGDVATACIEDAAQDIAENGFEDNGDDFLFSFETELERRRSHERRTKD